MKHLTDYILEASEPNVFAVCEPDVDNIILGVFDNEEEAQKFVDDAKKNNADDNYVIKTMKRSECVKEELDEKKCDCDDKDCDCKDDEKCPKCGKKKCECDKKDDDNGEE